MGSPRVLNRGYTPRRSLTLSTALQENCEAKLRSSVPLHRSLSVWSSPSAVHISTFSLITFRAERDTERATLCHVTDKKISLVYSYIYRKKGVDFLQSLVNTGFVTFLGCLIFQTLLSNFLYTLSNFHQTLCHFFFTLCLFFVGFYVY